MRMKYLGSGIAINLESIDWVAGTIMQISDPITVRVEIGFPAAAEIARALLDAGIAERLRIDDVNEFAQGDNHDDRRPVMTAS